jgi:hypothetical protein
MSSDVAACTLTIPQHTFCSQVVVYGLFSSLVVVLRVLRQRTESIRAGELRPLARCRWDVTTGLGLENVVFSFFGVVKS